MHRSACGIPRLVMRCRAVIEQVLAVVGDDEPARRDIGNPHIDPAIVNNHAPHWLAHASHEELVFTQLH